jgi:outer membrane protein assembly factor BamB
LKPDDGKVFWKYPLVDLLSESSTTPIHWQDMVMASSITVGGIGLKLSAADDRVSAKEVWKNPDLTCYFSTPVPIGTDSIYVVTGTKPPALRVQADLHCVDAHTGKDHWQKPHVGQYHASLTRMADNRLLLLEDTGDLVLLDPDPKAYRELARSKICGKTWAHPAISNGMLYVRDSEELVCIGLAD